MSGVSATDLERVPATSADVSLQILSQPRYLCGARDLVSGIARRYGFDERASGQLALAVDEALCNIIRHGYKERADGAIWIRVWPVTRDGSDEPAGIRIVIEDDAEQVNPKDIRGRDPHDLRPGGLGVYIIRNVMDTVRYEPRAEGGMRLILAKLLASERVE